MSNQFLKLRRSAVPGRIPTTASLDFGEIAINTYDGLAFLKKSGLEGEMVIAIGSTGSLYGTASWADNAVVAPPFSYVDTTIYSTNPMAGPDFSMMGGFFVGEGAGMDAMDAYDSTFIGMDAGLGASDAYKSIFIGHEAGSGSVFADNSVFIGHMAGIEAPLGFGSNFIGFEAGHEANLAFRSNFIGYNAGFCCYSASYSTIIGYRAGYVAERETSPGRNNIIIGTNITLPRSYDNGINIGGIIFGSGSYSNLFLEENAYSGSAGGRIGINQTDPQYELDVFGDGNYSGDLTVTGSIIGTASWAQDALTAYFITGSGVYGPFGSNSVLSASYAVNAATSSYAVSASYIIGGATTIAIEEGGIPQGSVGTLNFTGSSVDVSVSTGVATINVKDPFPYTGSALISGSLVVSGSVTTTEGFTGSLLGSSSYALTASFALNGGGGGSTFPYTGDAVISGSLTVTGSTIVTGTLTAQTLHVQYITASTEFITGSTKFGTQLTDTHQFTGSVTITGSLGISGPITDVDYIQFNTSASSNNEPGKLVWNDNDGTLNLGMKGGNVTLQMGQEFLTRVHNLEGATLTDGQLVAFSGSVGDKIGVKLADATLGQDASNIIGMVTEQILPGEEGFVTYRGFVRDLNTTLYLPGEMLYLDTVPGAYNNTPADPPNASAAIGYAVIIDAVTGSIYVDIKPHLPLGGIDDVLDNTTSASYGDLLLKSGSVWTNSKQLTGSYGLTGSLTISGSLNATSSWAQNAVSASYVLNAVSSSFASTASFVQTAQTASYVLNAISSSFASTASFVTLAQTASFVTTAQTASFVATASWARNSITASYVLNAVSSSFASTASFVQTAQTASFVTTAQTASFVTLAQTASFVTLAQTASFVATASWARNSITASYILNAVSASFASTASFVTLAQTASFVQTAQTASFVTTAQTASFVTTAQTASFVATASWAQNARTASFITGSNVWGPFGSNSVISSSYSATASFATTASYVLGGASQITVQDEGAGGFSAGTLNFVGAGVSVANPGGGVATINIPGAGGTTFPYTGSAIISGSLLVTGSISVTQGGFTGSLQGTASWAENAVSASYVQNAQSASYVLNAVSSSFASTASFVTLAQTASYVQTAQTASFVTASNVWGPHGSNSVLTASYAFTSSYAVNLIVSGGLTNVDYIDFDTASAATMQDARLKWDDGEGTLQLGLRGNVDANIGEQLYQYVHNAEATTLTKGTVVYVSGSQGGRIAVKRASATAEGASAETLGLAAEDILSGTEGWVITDGSLRGVNTSGLIGGRLIFLSSSAGEYTQTYPQAPLHGVRLGYVQKVDANPTQGILYIKIDNGYELDELHDVRITSASTGELLVRSGSLWINTRQMTGSYGLTGSLTATTVNASFFTASGNAYPTNSGISEYFLQTNGAGTLSWNYVRSVLESVKNVGSTTLVKGTPVYVTSSVGNTAEVVKADAASSSLMPATYILNETLTAGQQGLGIVLGFVNNIDTSGFEESDEVYVAVGGGYTNVQPIGSALIQPLGTVVRVDATNGSIMVSNTGVTNSIPNINPGYAWVGDSNWLPTAIATSSFFVNSASLALTASSGDAFTVRNFIELKPGTDPGTSNVSSSYFFVTTSSDNTEFNLKYRNNGALWETHWLEERTDTGIVWGGVLTFTSTTMSITPGAGLIVNHNASTASHGDTVATYVPFGPITASATFITSSQVTYLLIDENGQLVQQTTKFTPEQYNEKMPLGYIFCLTTSSISSYADARVTTYGQSEQGSEFIRAFGPLKLSGYDVTAQSGSLKVSIASGQSYRYGGFYSQNPDSPSLYDSTAVPTGSLVRIYRDPAVVGGFRAATNAGVPYTDIDPTKWDDGSGTLQTVGSGEWTIQRIFQGVVNNVSYVYYGQNTYASLTLALQSIATDSFEESPTSILALPFIGYVIAKGDATNLADTANNRIIQAGLFRNTAGSSGGGGAAAQSLDDLSDVTITSAINGQALVYSSGLWINGNPTSASYASTASYVLNAVSSSFASTASFITTAQTASFVTTAQTASFVATASWANNAITASFVTTAQTASFVTTAQTASFVTTAQTASFVTTAQTASFVTTAQTASFVATASWARNSITASFITTAQTASFVTTAQTASYVTGSIFTSANPALSASYALTASYALNGGTGGGLATKAGSIANTSFTGNPRKAIVTFSTPFANTSYGVVITGEDARTWTVEGKLTAGFTASANSNTGLAGTTYWIATAYGETT